MFWKYIDLDRVNVPAGHGSSAKEIYDILHKILLKRYLDPQKKIRKRPQTLQTPAKEVVGMMRLQGPVLQGTIRFEYTFRISLYFSSKMIEKKNQHTTPKRILNLKHTHRTSHNKKSPCYCWRFNLCNLHQFSLFSGASQQQFNQQTAFQVRWYHPISALSGKTQNPKNQITCRDGNQVLVAFGSQKNTHPHQSIILKDSENIIGS